MRELAPQTETTGVHRMFFGIVVSWLFWCSPQAILRLVLRKRQQYMLDLEVRRPWQLETHSIGFVSSYIVILCDTDIICLITL
jgi:hypothetical protein